MQAFTGLRGEEKGGGRGREGGEPGHTQREEGAIASGQKIIQPLLVLPEKKREGSFFFIIYLLHTRRVNNIDTSGGKE